MKDKIRNIQEQQAQTLEDRSIFKSMVLQMGKERYLEPNYFYQRFLSNDMSTRKGALCQELCNEANALAALGDLFRNNNELVEIIHKIGQKEENVPNWKVSICKKQLTKLKKDKSSMNNIHGNLRRRKNMLAVNFPTILSE